MKRNTGLILALDETNEKKAIEIASDVADLVDAVKVNWPLVLSAGPDIIKKLSGTVNVICDFKVADIPNTVRLIVEESVLRGAAGVIVHVFPGEDSLSAAVEAAGKKAEIYAVTEMSHPGGKTFTSPHAEEMAAIGVRCGVAGFVAPATRPDRIAAIRAIAGDRTIISPGVGAQGGSAASAISAGADYVIVGRAIYEAKDPVRTAEAICEEISSLL
jgi:orotidine 5''-phosphate decarboxylase, subfamily 1